MVQVLIIMEQVVSLHTYTVISVDWTDGFGLYVYDRSLFLPLL